jgi:signal transduction histidine kinase
VSLPKHNDSGGLRSSRDATSWRWPYWALALLFITIMTTGALIYREDESSARREVHQNLEAISSLKVAQIVQWRRELLGNAEDLASQPHLVNAVTRWLRQPNENDLGTITTSLRILKGRADLNDAMIVDTTGRLRLNLLGHPNLLDYEDHIALAMVLKERRPIFTSLHPHLENADAHVDVIAPFISPNGDVIGAVILETEAAEYLYPILKIWPTTNRTAETLLVRRVEDAVEFLNAPRHGPEAATPMRIPLARTEVPAVQAALGRMGIFEGRDYRGEPVVSVLRPIPDSPWFLVTKIDSTDAYANWRARSRLLLLLMATLALSTLAGFLWLRRSAASYRELSRAEAELRDYQAHLEETVTNRTSELQDRNRQLDIESVERREAVSRLHAANQRLAELAEERAAHLRKLASELTRAEQRERDRLHELLHDEVQPLLVAARLALSGINERSDSATCVRVATATSDHISQALNTARTLSTELSPPLIRERGLGPALESLCRLMASHYGLAVDFACDPDAEPTDMATRLLCFNAVRELLLNTVKHAGIRSVELSLQLENPETLRISVVDRGQGFNATTRTIIADTSGGGSGLSSIEWRLGMIGGRLTIDSQPGVGTTAVIWAPLRSGKEN